MRSELARMRLVLLEGRDKEKLSLSFCSLPTEGYTHSHLQTEADVHQTVDLLASLILKVLSLQKDEK